jgi:Raf kinase inhibitor-like YbhB/YbcL family protein
VARRRWVAVMAMTGVVIVAGCGSGGVGSAGPGQTGEAPSPSQASAPSSSRATTPTSSPLVSNGPAPTVAPSASAPGPSATPNATPSPEPFVLASSAFDDGAAIPRPFTCDGADRSPALAWTGVPAGTRALVLVVDDPDARGFVHWLVLDLPPGAAGSLPPGVAADAPSPQQGRNGFGRVGWGGPCPPSGTHHYRFILSALAAPLGLAGHPDGAAVQKALKGATVLGQATLRGTYRRG